MPDNRIKDGQAYQCSLIMFFISKVVRYTMTLEIPLQPHQR